MKRQLTTILAGMMAAFAISGCQKTPQEQPAIKVESITLNIKEAKLKVGETAQLEVTVSPDNVQYGAIEYKSDKPEIATVSDKGLINAVGVGAAVIIVTVEGKTATCTVTVDKIEVESIALDIEKKVLMLGKTVQLTALVYPETATDKTFQWQSSSKTIASVDQDGLVTALAPGDAAITVSCGTKSAVCNITVLDKAKVGDFYYADGTYSSSLNSDKTPIGIVFYVGNPAADDKALQREHPNCTNGLVVALKDISDKKVHFQKNMATYRDGAGKQYGSTIGGWVEANAKDYETTVCGKGINARVNKMLGYNNTRAMELFNKANPETPVDAIDAVIKFREAVPAPKETSDWYIPSIKDLAVLFWGEIKEGIDIVTTYDYMSDDFLVKLIDPKIMTIPGGVNLIPQDPYTKDTYFSSSEINEMHAFGMWVPDGSYPEKNTGKNSMYHCRAILAF